MTGQPGETRVLHTRFGVSPTVLEKARHLNDDVFPLAGVALYIQDQRAYAITSEREIVPVELLETLVEKADAEVIALIERAVETHHRRSRRPLRELRVEAGFMTQADLARFINETFSAPSKKTVMSSKTIWRAENDRPIATTKALLIIAALKARQVEANLESVAWVIGKQGKHQDQEGNSP